MKIRFCKHNKGKGKVYRRLEEEHPELDIKIKDCIKMCGSCSQMPTASVGKKKITGKDADDLYRKILDYVREHSAEEE